MSEWYDALERFNKSLYEKSLKRSLHLRSSPNQSEIVMDGRHCFSFASNDYLGLSNHPSLQEAMAIGASKYGVGSGASSLISGHTDIHDELEKKLALTQSLHIPNVEACFINTGFMANLSMLTALASLDAISIYSDELNHASLIDGIRMAKAQHQASVNIYPHSDLDSLQKLLAQDSNPFKLIVTDSVFSMDGDMADLPALLQIAQSYDALLYIDDAHGFGVFGASGHGSLEHFQIHSPRVIYMGTLGKAVGVSGAFLAADNRLIDLLIQKARPVIYSTAPSPAVAYTVLKSIELIESNEGAQRRFRLFQLIDYWNTHAKFEHWHCLSSSSAIQPLILGENHTVLEVSKSLVDLGFWIPAIRPPTVPSGSARLRITFNSDHTFELQNHLLSTLFNLEASHHAS
jgi:8-amino-7-oxononanoate synthase